MFLPLRIFACGLCLVPLPCAVFTPTVACSQAASPVRAADPISVGKTLHFTLDKGEQKDLSTTLAPGTYYIQADLKRVDEKNSNLLASIDLLKTNGTEVQGGILQANEIYPAARVAGTFTVSKPFTAAKPLAARLRIKNDDAAIEYWLTIIPVAQKTLLPFPSGHGDIKPLGMGTDNGKGGTLGENEWAYHNIKLPAGKYTMSLYMKQADGEKNNLLGQLRRLDAFGVEASPRWSLEVNAIGLETRQEEKLVLLKPQTVLFRVMNANNHAAEYLIGIEKADE